MSETLVLTVRVAVSLALVLGLLWFLSRRLGGAGSAPRRLPITVLGRQSLGRRSGVAVVDVAGRTLVLGISDASVRLLTELDIDLFEEPEDDESPTEGVEGPRSHRDLKDGRPSPLSGSVLAPQTWRTSWEALRGRIAR